MVWIDILRACRPGQRGSKHVDAAQVIHSGRFVFKGRLRDRNSAVLLVVRVHPVVHGG